MKKSIDRYVCDEIRSLKEELKEWKREKDS